MPVRLKRAYDAPSQSDGERYLVERLWPRGVKKDTLDLSGWLKDLAPSTELRQWYGHAEDRWPEFARRYEAELASRDNEAALARLADTARAKSVTLVYATHVTERSGAAVLKGVIERLMKSPAGVHETPIFEEGIMTSAKTSAYSRTHRLKGKLLAFSLKSEDDDLKERAAAAKNGRAAKTLVKQGPLRVTAVALRKGTTLQSHSVDGPLTIQTVRGRLRITTDDGEHDVLAGGLVSLDAGVAHTATAVNDASMLITILEP